jgi:hypothetical protein
MMRATMTMNWARHRPHPVRRQGLCRKDQRKFFILDAVTRPCSVSYHCRAAKKPAPVPIEISSDSEEEATPVARRSRAKPRYVLFFSGGAASFLTLLCGTSRSKVKEEEAEVDADIDHLLDHNNNTETTFDSIMDADSEEEEEVNDLLAEE